METKKRTRVKKDDLQRAKTCTDILKMKFKTLPFEGAWNEAFGLPETTGIWFISGKSSNGKTSFTMQLVKELARHGKVIYNSMEEGTRLSLQNSIVRFNLSECGNNLLFLNKEPMENLSDRLLKKNSAPFVIIDSFQCTFFNMKAYYEFKRLHQNKLVIFTSQVEGNRPMGRTAVKVDFDADLKIWVEGYKAFSRGRFKGATGEYVIWPEKAQEYWGETK